jgi:transcription termination/antitermination protein NusA
MQTPRTEFAQALRAIASERGLEPDVILETIKQAIIAAYKRDARERGEDVDVFDFDVELDPTSGEAKVYAWPLVAEDATEEGAVSLEELLVRKEKAKQEKKDVTPPGFGRIAAQTAKQVIHQKIREAEKGAVMDEFSSRVGGLITGMILRFDGPDVRVDLGRTEGIMPKEERVPDERLNPNQRLTFLLKAIEDTLKGKQIILSRADAAFVQKLFEREVPEMGSGSVEVKAIVREAGIRTKMAVFSNQSGVDPVGSCVGQKGVRVQAVTNELGGERVDIIQYSENVQDLIKAALSPAESLSVKLEEKTKTAVIKAPEDQLSLAIGKDGQNARLAAKLTGWKIEIKAGVETKKPKKNEVKPQKEEKEKESKKKAATKKVSKKVNGDIEKSDSKKEPSTQRKDKSEKAGKKEKTADDSGKKAKDKAS